MKFIYYDKVIQVFIAQNSLQSFVAIVCADELPTLVSADIFFYLAICNILIYTLQYFLVLCHLVFDQRNTRHEYNDIMALIHNGRCSESYTRRFAVYSGFDLYSVYIIFRLCTEVSVTGGNGNLTFFHFALIKLFVL